MNIADIIKQIAGDNGISTAMVCKVTAVDKKARTVDCAPINEDAPLLGVNLQANQGSTVGVLQFPRIGSYVIVGFIAEGAAGVVLACDDIECLTIVINDISIMVDETGIQMNGGSLGGLVKVEELTKRLNLIEKDLNALKTVFKKWTPKPNDGGASLKTSATSWASSTLTVTKREDYENNIIKQ